MYSQPSESMDTFQAVIFDLDGVITRTALLHSHAWKKMFDAYLKSHTEPSGELSREFDHEKDYLRYVDGKSRFEGVKSFLESRNINLPYGHADDEAGIETICGLGNHKNKVFHEVLETEGVQVFESSILLIKQLKSKGIKMGVASSSRNAGIILERAGLTLFFDTIVDGNTLAELRLPGKPEPDIFLKASENLNTTPYFCVIVEDAAAGITAASKGNFGLVLGIARENNRQELLNSGADVVVSDLAEVSPERLDLFYRQTLENDPWSLKYYGYNPSLEGLRETLLTTGNGLIATRGAMEEHVNGDKHYPGTYHAGLYNRLTTRLGEHELDNEDLVNCPNWLTISFQIDDGNWVDASKEEILTLQRNLDFRNGLLTREMSIRDAQGRISRVLSRRFVSMENPQLMAISYTVIPQNYQGTLHIRSGLDGNIRNEGVARYNQLNNQHWMPAGSGHSGSTCWLKVKTVTSGIVLLQAARHQCFVDGHTIEPPSFKESAGLSVHQTFSFPAAAGTPCTLEKSVSVLSNLKSHKTLLSDITGNTFLPIPGFQDLLQESEQAWGRLWAIVGIPILQNKLLQKLSRLNCYHLLASFSPHNLLSDTSIPARGLHGEAYRGHIFWDELFILPFYARFFPEMARAMLMYRYRRLTQAKANAIGKGHQGALYPWQSGSSGTEETQRFHLNPLSGKWDSDHSKLQYHVSLAIAYNIIQYVHLCGDQAFLLREGSEMLTEIIRFWVSICIWNEGTRRFDIKVVVGPDEFHEKYPGKQEAGIANNAYTNLMLAWLLDYFLKFIEKEPAVIERWNISEKELAAWKEVSFKINIPVMAGGLIGQFEGYFDLEELDWDHYRKKYGDLSRLDRILKAEGFSPDNYRISKQADVIQLFYNLNPEVIRKLLHKLGYQVPEDFVLINYHYYLKRTSHGSSLSKLVFAKVAFDLGDDETGQVFLSASLAHDYSDGNGPVTKEGIHTGVMAGSLLLMMGKPRV